MVLAYEEDEQGSKKTKKREIFEKNLREQGLQLETESKTVSQIIARVFRTRYQTNKYWHHVNKSIDNLTGNN